MKKYFLTGLAVILPILVTWFILMLLLRLLTAPFMGFASTIAAYLNASDWFPSQLQSPDTLRLLSQICIVFILFLTTVFVGFLGKIFLMNALFRLGDKIAHSIPFANKIYKSVQDVIQSLMSQETPSFSQVVQVPFPHQNAFALGFITREQEILEASNETEAHVSIFVPGTPNPTMGFILMVPKDQVILTKISVEQAIKFIVSCGVIYPAPAKNSAKEL